MTATANEILAVPEEHLREVIAVIREGLNSDLATSQEVCEHLEEWCAGEEAYLDDLGENS